MTENEVYSSKPHPARSYYSMEHMEGLHRSLEEKQAALAEDEGLQEALWRCQKINEFLAKYNGMIDPCDVELIMKGGATYWHMNRNPSHIVRFKDFKQTQRNLFKKYTEKGEQGEFYWVLLEGV